MTQLNAAQIASHAAAGGWSGEALVTAVAVALAESGGRTDARGDVTLQTGTWGPSIGLFQIRSIKSQKGTGGQRDETANLDPGINAKHAHEIWAAAGGFRPWSVYNTGAYRIHLLQARAAAAAPAAGGAVTPVATVGVDRVAWQIPVPLSGGMVNIPIPFGVEALTGPAQAAANAAELLKNVVVYMVKTARWMGDPANWLRVAKVGAGMVLIGGAVIGLLWPAVAPAAKLGTKVASKGIV